MVLFLHPRGKIKAASTVNLRSRQGLTDWRLSWKIAKLWEVPALELLASGDVGLIPWVPLTQFDGPPEPIVRLCRDRIDQDAPPGEHENLLAVTQFLARLRYDDPRLFQILGGRRAMIESPLLDELKAEWTLEARRETTRRAILKFLEGRFGPAARSLEAELKSIDETGLTIFSHSPLRVAASRRFVRSSRRETKKRHVRRGNGMRESGDSINLIGSGLFRGPIESSRHHGPSSHSRQHMRTCRW